MTDDNEFARYGSSTTCEPLGRQPTVVNRTLAPLLCHRSLQPDGLSAPPGNFSDLALEVAKIFPPFEFEIELLIVIIHR